MQHMKEDLLSFMPPLELLILSHRTTCNEICWKSDEHQDNSLYNHPDETHLFSHNDNFINSLKTGGFIDQGYSKPMQFS
jgi:hypothetical protein